jgi:hypothetical protein
MQHFDEKILIHELENLSPNARVLFASFCAVRLLPAIRKYLKKINGEIHFGVFQDALELVWALCLNNAKDETGRSHELEDLILSHMPSEDDPQWTSIFAYAEDAMASIVFVLRATQSGELNNIMWAARRAYEAVDQFVLDGMEIEIIGTEEEQFILQSAVVQQELERQERDLRDLLTIPFTSYKALIERARHESAFPFGRGKGDVAC